MKWIAIALIVVGILQWTDHNNWFFPLAAGLGLLAYWYFVEREPDPSWTDGQSDVSNKETSQPLTESSTSFRLGDFEPFLERLIPYLSGGFDKRVVSHLVQLVRLMKHIEERQLQYQVLFRGETAPLQISLFKSDIEEITVYFFTHPSLADLISNEMDNFFAERGI